MSRNTATDNDVETLRRSGQWALYWELLHSRGSREALETAWATLTDDERPAARAGLEAAREARRERFAARSRASALARVDDQPEYVDNPVAYAQQLFGERENPAS
ncbi:MAG: hypothetical protein GY708_02490 [Actinomycetia bacterium]|nr:hypothetical protein [Actinomycetes bacterium]